MNYILKKIKDNRKKFLISLTAFFAIILALIIIFYSSKSSSQALPECRTLANGVEADPGRNCLYFGLPICTSTLTAASTITNPQHRINCADLIDLPLCSDFSLTALILPNKNCVSECSSIPQDSTKIRGIEYAVHNKNCIRFCDNIEENVSPYLSDNAKCVTRNCHQIAKSSSGTLIAGTNQGYTKDDNGNPSCNLLPCNLLTTDELNNSKFEDATKKYCEGDNLKCYQFSESKLPYLISRNINTMCKIHDCPPPNPSPVCGNDVNNINALGSSFKQNYAKYILGTNPLSSENIETSLSTICKPIECKPIVPRSYRCLPENNDNPTTLNSNCDTTSSCVNGYCIKNIDCNLSSNNAAPECLPPQNDSEDTDDDSNDSWFYRPRPMDKSTFGNGSLYTMKDNQLCYSQSQFESDDEHEWGKEIRFTIPFPPPIGSRTINLGYFHAPFRPDATRSPGMCGVRKVGFRGPSYLYLCGNEMNLYKKVSDETAYHKGKVTTEFLENDAISKINVCLRFKNMLRPFDPTNPNSETCGRRECAVVCNFGICMYQQCGYDVCKELTVRESQGQSCMMNDDLFGQDIGFVSPESQFESSSIEEYYENSLTGQAVNQTGNFVNSFSQSNGCLKNVDGFLRLRAVQYGNRICTFLDVKGQFAYNKMFLDGSEKLSDGTCLSGTANADGECVGSKDTNAVKGEATKWRTILRIPYIKNNRPSITDPNLRGYTNRDGKLIKEQECMNIPLRISPPRVYNLGNFNNSTRLFSPPLYILNANTQRDGSASTTTTTFPLGITDFNYPEIVVKYGETTQKLSLGIGKTGYEIEDGSIDLASKARLITEFQGNNLSVNVFVRKEYDLQNSVPKLCLYQTITNSQGIESDLLIDCVRRRFPEINNFSNITSTNDRRKIIVSAPTTPVNSYDNSSIVMQYQAKNGEISDIITLNNPIQQNPVCQTNIERYKVCAQRDECNQLNNECVNNEIAIQNAALGSDINSLLNIRNDCFNNLQPKCYLKKGFRKDDGGNYNQTINNAYGWFDEICISSGFENKLRNIVAYKATENGVAIDSVRGKCVIDVSLSRAGANCSEGGKAPDCICLEAIPGITLGTNQTVRKETPREAGLCIDLPLPANCPAINYSSAAARTSAVNYGHAEFPLSIFGMNNVEGQCLGNWKKAVVAGVETAPKMNCIRNADDTASWSSSVINSCVRYTCPQIFTNDPNVDITRSVPIIYSNSYSALDGEDETEKGKSHGYALWPKVTSNDSSQNISATSCITGFEKNGSALPTRQCNSTGQWQVVTNSCVRKKCPAINFISSSPIGSTQWNSAWATNSVNPELYTVGSASWYNVWQSWGNSGGASFATTNASRNATTIQYESIATGICNTMLGYYSGGVAPTRTCDANGNWGPVQNPCVTSCNAITETTTPAPTTNDGFAYWEQAQVAIGDSQLEVTARACRSGYKMYPYSPPKDVNGNNINQTASGIYVEGASQMPKRLCKTSTSAGVSRSAYWNSSYPACVNKCPGATTDSRIGVGRTQHKLSDGTTITLSWNDADAGSTQTIASPTSITDHSVSNYDAGRNNKFYIVSRECGTDLRWKTYIVNGVTETVKPMCSGRSGSLNNTNATFSSTNNTIIEGQTITGLCNTNYGTRTTNPIYTCKQKDNNRFIDQFYYEKTGGGSCVRICPIPTAGNAKNAQFGSVGSYYKEGASGVKYLGDTITLSCIENYGRAIDTNSSNSDNSCGRTATDRTNISPTASCQENGSWSIVNNGYDCSPCRNCSPTGYNYGKYKYMYRYKNCSGSVDQCFIIGSEDRAASGCGNDADHKEAVTFDACSHNTSCSKEFTGSRCSSTSVDYKCIDGQYQLLNLDSWSCENSNCK